MRTIRTAATRTAINSPLTEAALEFIINIYVSKSALTLLKQIDFNQYQLIDHNVANNQEKRYRVRLHVYSETPQYGQGPWHVD